MANFLDSVIQVVAPRLAVKREASRQILELLDQQRSNSGRGYDAGGNGRRQQKVDRRNRSAPTETLNSLPKLRGFSRELQRNEPLVFKALNVRTNNVIGSGIKPAIKSNVALVQRMNREVWAQWAETPECDYDGLNNIYGLQRLVNKAVDQDGEVLVVRRRVKDGYLPIRLQVLEADLLDEAKTQPTDSGGWITQGVEFDSSGRRVAYWLYKTHPFEMNWYQMPLSERIPAEDIIHVFDQERPGQVRGIPMGVQAFMTIRDLGEFQDAELVTKKIQACYAVFVTTSGEMPNMATERQDRRIEPGTLQYLPAGDTATVASPPKSDGYGEYIRVNEQRVAMGYEITYESLSNDLSNVNFSSGRMGWIEAARGFSGKQNRVIIPLFCDRVFSWFSDAAVMAGRVSKSATVTWTPPRRELIDPAKEVSGIKDMIRSGLSSWQEEARALGWNIEDLIEELKKDKDMWDQLGLSPDCDPRFDKTPTAGK